MLEINEAFSSLGANVEEEYDIAEIWVGRETKSLRLFLSDSLRQNKFGFENMGNGLFLNENGNRDFLVFEYPLFVLNSNGTSGTSYHFFEEIGIGEGHIEDVLLGLKTKKGIGRELVGDFNNYVRISDFSEDLGSNKNFPENIFWQEVRFAEEEKISVRLFEKFLLSDLYFEPLEIAEKVYEGAR